MSRSYFPTRNSMGVRSFSPTQTLGRYHVDRAPAESRPKAAMTPTLLGSVFNVGARDPRDVNPIVRGPFGEFPQGGAPSGAPATPTSTQTSPTPTVQTGGWQPPNWVSVSSGGGTRANPTPAATAKANVLLAQYNNELAAFNGYMSTGDTPDALTAYQTLQNLAAQLGPLGVNVQLPTPPPGVPSSSQNYGNPWQSWMLSQSAPSGSLSAASGTSAANLTNSYNQYLALYNSAVSSNNSTLMASYGSALQTLAAQLAALGVTVTLPPGITTAAASEAAAAAAPAVTVAAPTSTTDEVAAWLEGSTTIGSYAIPNPLIAGAVVLGFALLMGRHK